MRYAWCMVSNKNKGEYIHISAHVYGYTSRSIHLAGLIKKFYQFDCRGRLVQLNSNEFDYRRNNLRVGNFSQSHAHKGKQKNNKTGYKGVSWYEKGGYYQATIRAKGKSIYLGIYRDPILAAKAYDRAAIEYYGEFARINFPKGDNKYG
jgi:hypothetical protein